MDVVGYIHSQIENPGMVDIRGFSGFYPSSVSIEYERNGETRRVGTCLRQQYYYIAGVPKSNSGRIIDKLKAAFGNAIHDEIAEILKTSGIYIAAEKRIYRGLGEEDGLPPISGRCDIVLQDPVSGLPVVVEVKSSNDSSWYFLKNVLRGGSKAGEEARPKEDHVAQLLLYIDYYGKYGVEKGILLYVGRATGEMKQFIIRMTEEGSAFVQSDDISEVWEHVNIHSINKRWNQLLLHISQRSLPPRDYDFQYSNQRIVNMYDNGELNKTDTATVKRKLKAGKLDCELLKKGDWQCSWCDFRDICLGIEWDEEFNTPRVANPIKLPKYRQVDTSVEATDPMIQNEDAVSVL